MNSTQLRIASVYVIVINREKMYDSQLHNRFRPRPKPGIKNMIDTSSDEDDDELTEPALKDNNLKGDTG